MTRQRALKAENAKRKRVWPRGSWTSGSSRKSPHKCMTRIVTPRIPCYWIRFFSQIDATAVSLPAVGEVFGARRSSANPISLPLIALITPHPGFSGVKQMRQRRPVMDVDCRDQSRVDKLGFAVHPNMCLHSKIPLLTLGGLVHLRITCAVFSRRRARCADDRRINNRTVENLDAVAAEIFVHGHQPSPGQFVLRKQMSKLAHCGLIGRRLRSQVYARKASDRRRVVKRLLHSLIRQMEPQLQKMDAQHWVRRYRVVDRTVRFASDKKVRPCGPDPPTARSGPYPRDTVRGAWSSRISQIPSASAASSQSSVARLSINRDR